MVSTPTAILRLELQGSQDNAGTWNVNANQIVQSLEDANAGFVDTATTGGTTALTAVNYAVDTGRKPIHRIANGQTLVSTVTITTTTPREYLVHNASSAGSFDVRFGGDASNYVTIPRGCIAKVLVRANLTTCFAGPLITVASGEVNSASLATLYAKFPVEAENMGIAVISSTLATPPGSPTTGDKYIVPTGGLVAWTGKDAQIAEWDGAAWAYTVAVTGMIAWDRTGHFITGYDAAGWARGTTTEPIPVGGVTFMMFRTAAAPTGWTISTTHHNKAVRIVSSAGAASGGTVDFSTLYARTATDAKVLDATMIPPHTHDFTTGTESATHTHTQTGNTVSGGTVVNPAGATAVTTTPQSSSTGTESATHTHSGTTGNGTGGGLGHTHDIDMRVKYVDIIICSRD